MNHFHKFLASIFVAWCLTASSVLALQFEVSATSITIQSALKGSPEIASFYRERNFEPIWTNRDAASTDRIVSFIEAIESAPNHGLPFGEAESRRIKEIISLPRSALSVGLAEAELSRMFVSFASTLITGAVNPNSVVRNIYRHRAPPDAATLLAGITAENPSRFISGLAPTSQQYAALRKELMRLDQVIRGVGWGPTVDAESLRIGDDGQSVVQLRNRLIRMGYLGRTSNPNFNSSLEFAVKRFQRRHGLTEDGIVGPTTLSAINATPQQRRRQVIAALERERWLNQSLGEEHVLVNIANFHADVISSGKSIFSTRVVVGKSSANRQTPEFSNQMTYFVINPTWHVPRSIATEEILPKLQANRFAESSIVIYSENNERIDRPEIDFGQYSSRHFPLFFKQPPGPGNALGQVKFMFPNEFSVYMHDTPQKSLFLRDQRDFSHGCIRLHRAADFARFLLARTVEDDPETYFKRAIARGRELVVTLPKAMPVHITYQTAFVDSTGRIQYRKDIYERDEAIFEGLERFNLIKS